MNTVIAIVNESSDITDKQARRIQKACHIQLKDHVAPLWDRKSSPVRFYTKEKYVPKNSLVIMILPDEDGASYLGYHDETPGGRPYGRVFTTQLLDDGGSIYDDEYSISVVTSHEVIEAFIDPDINLWAEGEPGVMWSYEACDPVQEDAYSIDVGGEDIFVSNFVLPGWFDRENPKNARYDYMERLKGPFRMTRGGYAVYWDGGPEELIKNGYRSRRRKAGKNHVAARSVRRTCHRLEF